MTARIDLHVHTTASDGTLTPTEVVCRARELGLSAIAVTDHDTHEGIREALDAGKQYGIEVIPGIEISVAYQNEGIHILGYFIDPDSPAIQTLLDWVIAERKRRNRLIAKAMQDDGIPVDMNRLKEKYPGTVIGRPHIAAELVELGLADSVEDGFDRYLNKGCKYFREREYIPIEIAFSVIREAGGKAVIAHPLQYGLPEPEFLRMIEAMKAVGAVGMECRYLGYTAEETAALEQLAEHYGLCVTGGSDFHGAQKPQNEMGTPEVPYALLEALRNR